MSKRVRNEDPRNGKRAPKKSRLTGETAGIKSYTPKIALRSIDGHLTRTENTITAWYRLSPQRWSFRSDQARIQLIGAIAGQYSELQGRWLHIRVTSRPYPIDVWAKAHVENSPRPLPDAYGGVSFDDYLIGEQRQLRGRAMMDKEVYLGIEVQRRGLTDIALDAVRPVLQRIAPSLLDAELKAIDAEVRHLDSLVAAPGLEGSPVTAAQMRWLLHRSCNLGMPAPRRTPGVDVDSWTTEDLAALTEGCDAFQEPYAPSVTVKARSGEYAGRERHVVVLTVGQMQPLQIPEHDRPWMQQADGLGIPVEWSGRLYIRDPAQVQNELQHQLGKVKSQIKHFQVEHETEPPQALARQADLANAIDDELEGQWGTQNTRIKGWFRVAVSGDTREEALEYAQALINIHKPKIEIDHPEDQYHLRREFIPGEPLANTAYVRKAPVIWAAAAVPAATADVGDRRGIILGETAGATQQPVAWDPWLAQEVRDSSGLTAIVAGLGGGKSYLAGGVVYKTLRTGAHWTVLDPSGPLSRLCDIPELKPFSRSVNLLNAEPGILNPYRVVPNPLREHFAYEADPTRAYHRAGAEAAATRRRLCEDVLVGVLPFEIGRMGTSRIVIKQAVREVGGGPDRHPGMVIDQLRRNTTQYAEDAIVVHGWLDEMREQLKLLIPEDDADPYGHQRDDRLTVLTMPGLILPKEGNPREYWTDAEALGAELLSLAAWLTQRNVYSGPPQYELINGQPWQHARKGVVIDEAFVLAEVAAGRALVNRLVRDSRKWNVRALLASQVPTDILRIPGIVSLLDSVFVGRLSDEAVQADALKLLGIPPGVGYEDLLATLAKTASHMGTDGTYQRDRSPRQFIFSDGAGGKERIRIDFSGEHLSNLQRALDTTPGSPVTPPRLEIQAALNEAQQKRDREQIEQTCSDDSPDAAGDDWTDFDAEVDLVEAREVSLTTVNGHSDHSGGTE